jgi:cell division protein YceG involved in septum cleavage
MKMKTSLVTTASVFCLVLAAATTSGILASVQGLSGNAYAQAMEAKRLQNLEIRRGETVIVIGRREGAERKIASTRRLFADL